ncbi:MAG: family 10 glycosylhydrolase [Candidatus Neomarinimicrobiota bacterium]|jgi:uncharacterized lipoprotein YddW (UPF0748 family)
MTALLVFSLTAIGQTQSRIGLWVVRDQLYSQEKIETFIDFAVQNEIQDLFVQVRGRGDAFYRSNIVVGNENLNNSSWDPLEYTLNRAHQHGLRVHAWINVFLLWSADQKPKNEKHLLYQHPEWCAVDADGVKDIQRHSADFNNIGTEGIYLSPLVPEVHEYIIGVIRELAANYALDGVHLDYVRYAKNCYDYHPVGRLRFRQQSGVDPLLLTISDRSLYKGLELAEIDSLTLEWDNFRRNAISDLIQNSRKMLKETRPTTLLSAAVKPDPEEARKHFFQDWQSWLKQDWLDFVVLMNYTRDSEQFERILKKCNSNQRKDKVWVGIGVYNQSRYDAMTKALITLNNQFPNVVFFSFDTFLKDPQYFTTLRKAFEIARLR